MKILILDDEVKICRLIKALIHWDTYDLEFVGMAHDGLSGLTLIKELKPDIVITDIRMPGLDGMELIEEARKFAPNVHFIIISGYSYFEYAKKAIRFGVSDYLLKPIDEKELNACIERIQSEIDETESISSKVDELDGLKKSQARLDKGKEVLSYFLSDYEELPFFTHDKAYLPFLIRLDGNVVDEYLETSLNYIKNEIDTIDEGSFCAYGDYEDNILYGLYELDKDCEDQAIRSLKSIQEACKARYFVSLEVIETLIVGVATSSKEELFQQVRSLKQQKHEGLLLPIDMNRYLSLDQEFDATFHFEEERDFAYQFLDKAIGLDSLTALNEGFAKLKELQASNLSVSGLDHYRLAQCIQVRSSALFQKHLRQEEYAIFSKDLQKAVTQSASVSFLYQAMALVIGVNISKKTNSKNRIESKPIQDAIYYMERNYQNSLSLEEVANHVNLSSTYLSDLFKKVTSINFKDYIVNIRIEHAQYLLKSTELPVAKICEQVGYYDQKHFTKLFRKVSGIRPSEYRAAHKR